MKVLYLAEHDLDASKDDHERVVWRLALHIVSVFVETVWPLNSTDYKAVKRLKGVENLLPQSAIYVNSQKSEKYVKHLHHANRCSDSVADSDANKIPILSQSTQLDLPTS